MHDLKCNFEYKCGRPSERFFIRRFKLLHSDILLCVCKRHEKWLKPPSDPVKIGNINAFKFLNNEISYEEAIVFDIMMT